MTEILGVIPARGGSKGVPRKNIRPLAGLPLIAYTIQAGLQAKTITDLVVTTDDPDIQAIAIEHGAQVPFLRPDELATDRALAIPTIQHALFEMERHHGKTYDAVVMLQPTTPLRLAEDIDTPLAQLMQSNADAVISVKLSDNNHPIKMKRIEGDRLVDYQHWPVENPPRQSLPPVYIVNGSLYATKRDVFVEHNTFRGGYCLAYEMPENRSVNIDNETDFLVAEHYMHKRQQANDAN